MVNGTQKAALAKLSLTMHPHEWAEPILCINIKFSGSRITVCEVAAGTRGTVM